MELDKRIINNCHPYDCFSNTEEVSQYSNGWFSNNLEDFTNLDNIKFGPLTGTKDSDYPFQTDDGNFKYFLPYCMAKIVYVNFRPYQSVKELPFTVGDVLFLKDSISLITLGTTAYSVQELFENYRWRFTETGDWKPFGEKECD